MYSPAISIPGDPTRPGGKDPRIVDIRHPNWVFFAPFWRKWRLTYFGGDAFIVEYCKKFSEWEDAADYKRRKDITPVPAFAKAAINDIKNSIFQRMVDITRRGGDESYQAAVEGRGHGVDLHGASMNSFLGRHILPELLTMARVGIFVDMPAVEGYTMMDQQGVRPYIYMYRTEEILSWTYRRDSADEYQSILLRDHLDSYSPMYGLPFGTWSRYRHIWLEDGKVHMQFYNDGAQQVDMSGNPNPGIDPIIINIPFIPFVVLELNNSLLADVANHQIALLNMESSDISYALKSNFPFYVEQGDPRAVSGYLKGPSPAGNDGTSAQANLANSEQLRVGGTQGRRYALGANSPGFIAPPSEPLKISMEKQKALKEDIRQLVNLALANVQPKMASAESKALDNQGLESGLSYIGLELEHAERKIAKYWAAFMGQATPVATVNYPRKYSLLSDEDRRANAEHLEKLRDSVPSPTFQKLISKKIAHELLAANLTDEEMQVIFKEIESGEAYSTTAENIFMAVEKGILDLELAAKLLGYPDGTPKKAAKEHAERLARIAESQASAKGNNPGARGVTDQEGSPGEGAKDEKTASRDTNDEGTPATKVRGEGK